MSNGGKRTENEFCEKQVKGDHKNGQVYSDQRSIQPQHLQQWQKKTEKENKVIFTYTHTDTDTHTHTHGFDTTSTSSYSQIRKFLNQTQLLHSQQPAAGIFCVNSTFFYLPKKGREELTHLYTSSPSLLWRMHLMQREKMERRATSTASDSAQYESLEKR